MPRNLRKIQRGNPTGSGDPLRSTAGGSPPAAPAGITRLGFAHKEETGFPYSMTVSIPASTYYSIVATEPLTIG